MTPGERSWLERMIAQWGESAAQTRRIACTRQSALNRAGGLEEIVAGLQRRLDAASPPIVADPEPGVAPPTAAAAVAWRPIANAIQAHKDDMAAYRARRAAGDMTPPYPPRRNFFAEWAAEARAEQGNAPVTTTPMTAPAPDAERPPPVAEAFTAGPQLDLGW